MKLNLKHGLCAAVLAAAITSAPVSAQIRGNIWSGYGVTAGRPYTSASATWQIPNLSVDGAVSGVFEDAVHWVGIGGWGDSTLIQLGTSASVFSPGGVPQYNVWYELFPAGEVNIPRTVSAGDTITASLQCTANCTPAQVQTWLLTMTDATAPNQWTWTQSFQYQSSMATAEWITEAPLGQFGEAPLADYGKVTFDPVSANGANPHLTLATNGMQMLDPAGGTSNPSAPVNGNVFSTCWGLAPSFTPCTAGSITTTPPPPAPTASLSAYPTSVTRGQASTLTWSSTNASSCTDGGFSGSGISGKAVVYPTVTTAYSVTCTGAGGSATAMATVTMSSPKMCFNFGGGLCF